MKKLLIHVCCAVCAAALVDLLKDKFEISLFFYNPNIHPEEEYLRRKESVEKLAKIYGVKFIEGDYDRDDWLKGVRGLEGEPEGGRRCLVCFKERLLRTFLLAEDYFTTTLSLSPYKSEEDIDKIGREIRGNFLSLKELGIDKKEIWRKTKQLSRDLSFYHQKYCGCVFSLDR